MADSFDYATKVDLYEMESRLERELAGIHQTMGTMRQDIGELKGQMTIMIRLAYYMAGMLSAIALKILFFTTWTLG
jgi:hypothetical protein